MLAADPSRKSINSYINKSRVIVSRDSNKLTGVGVISNNKDKFEIRNLSVQESHQGLGIGKRLVEELISVARNGNGKQLIVGTGNSSLGQLKFYQKCGFKYYRVIEGYFDSYPEPIFENDLQCRDLVYLKFKL